MQRRLDTFFLRQRRERCSVVVHPKTHERPTVVRALANPIELIAAAQAVFRLVNHMVARVDHKALRVAVTITPHCRQRVLAIRKRIISGNFSIEQNAKYFAIRESEVLGLFLLPSLSNGEINKAPVENDP